jgi:hypothetical protein
MRGSSQYHDLRLAMLNHCGVYDTTVGGVIGLEREEIVDTRHPKTTSYFLVINAKEMQRC